MVARRFFLLLLIACILCTYLSLAAPVNIKEEIMQNSPIDAQGYEQVKENLAKLAEIAQEQLQGGHVNNSMNDKSNSIVLQSPYNAEPLVAQYLFEGDIVLTPLQSHVLVSNALDAQRRRREPTLDTRRVARKIYSDLTARWSTLVPIQYKFDADINAPTRAAIRNATLFWQEHTCLAFEEASIPGRDFLQFFAGQGCYSMIGKAGGRQGVSIGVGCGKMGVVAHEIGHALGLWHEQSRPDSDTKIRVLSQNVIPLFLSNFLHRDPKEILLWDDVPYDLGSVMHYGPQAFTADYTEDTIKTRLPGYQHTIGQRESPSFYDVKAINKAYCWSICDPLSAQKCLYGGYPHPRNCSECICPDGLSGQRCELSAPAQNAECGGILDTSNDWQTLSSPGYEDYSGYKTGQSCSWLIRAPVGHQVLMEFLGSFQFFCTATCLDYVEVKNGSNFADTGMRFCCFDLPREEFISTTNEMLVLFRTTVSTDIGFQARFKHFPDVVTTTSTISYDTTTTEASTTTRRRFEFVPLLITGLPFDGGASHHNLNSTTTSTDGTDDPSWSAWSDWTVCSKTCGACGVKSRNRECLTPPCLGERFQFRRCEFAACPDHSCTEAAQFDDSLCTGNRTAACFLKLQQLKRKCDVFACCSPYQLVNGMCQVGFGVGTWGQWSAFGSCVGPSCGGCAIRKRYRVCEDWSCDGTDTDYERCNLTACSSCESSNGASQQSACPCCAPLRSVGGICTTIF